MTITSSPDLPPEPERLTVSNRTTAVCVDARELIERLDDIEVVDVRTPGEFEGIHVPKARNRPLDELDRHVEELRSLVEDGQDVVLVCRAGSRAHQAQEQLSAAGLPELPILEGGMLAWEEAGGPVVRDVIRWDLERQVRLVVGLVVLLSIAVSIVFPPARFIAGAMGAGLVFAALSNTCMLGMLLTKLPYNRPRSATES